MNTTDCAQCGGRGTVIEADDRSSAKCDQCGALSLNPDHPANLFAPGTRVRIDSHGQIDTGVVTIVSYDEEGNRITDDQVAVTVDNGQGTWGFAPAELSRIGDAR